VRAGEGDPPPERVLFTDEPIGEDATQLPHENKAKARDRMGGNGGMMGGAGMMGGGGSAPGYDVTWFPSQNVSDQNARFQAVRQGLNVGLPIWRNDRGDMLMTRLSVRHTHFDTDAILPDTRRAFPDALWNLNLGLNYMHRFDNGWMGMVMAGVGSASDRPFASINEVTATLGVILRVPAANERDSWQFGAMYMAGGPVNFPLPIIAYHWNPQENLRVNIGLPLSVDWQPDPDWALHLSYTPLLNINARVTHHFTKQWHWYAGYEFGNESYFLADRANTQERFFALEQRVITGVRWDVSSFSSLELFGGYAFGRQYGEGDSQWGSLRDRVDVDSGLFLGVAFRLRF
jgi:hypothetical protein